MQKEIQKFLTEHLGKADFKLDTIKKRRFRPQLFSGLPAG